MTPIKLSRTGARLDSMLFVTPFNTEVINALRQGNMKMPNVELYEETVDREEHLKVYKAQM